MLGPLDEFPVHQVPQPIAWPGSSDRNFYDRSYFNAHDRTGDIFVISGIGYYPNLGVKDAFLLIRRGDTQTAVHLSDAVDQDRLNQNVNGYRVDVIDPLHKLRIVLDETEGIAADLTWEGLFDVVQEQPHILRTGNRVTLNAQRFAQLGSWSGRIVVDGKEIAVDPATWIGSRDRSWGIRPIGEPEPAGRPADPPFEGMWWLYVPMAFEDFAVVLIIQEEPNGFRALNDCTRIWRDGRVEQLGWPRVKIHYLSGTRIPTGATIDATAPAVPAATSSHGDQLATTIATKAAYVTAAKAKSAGVSRTGGWPLAAVSIPQPNSTTVPVSTASTRRWSSLQAARSNFAKMLVMCFSTAPGVTTRLSAIAVFDRPSAIRVSRE